MKNNTNQIITDNIIAKLNEFSPLAAETTAQLIGVNDGDDIPDIIDAEGDDIERYGFSWSSIASNEWTDACGEHIYEVDNGVFAHIGNHNRSIHLAESIEAFLSLWDCDNYGSPEGLLVAFGLSPDLDAVADDYSGPCKVWITYNYYMSQTNPPQNGWVRDGEYNDGPITIFASVEEAKQWISDCQEESRGYKTESNPRGCYLLSNGEACPPDFTICAA